jgi:hypothetical protein
VQTVMEDWRYVLRAARSEHVMGIVVSCGACDARLPNGLDAGRPLFQGPQAIALLAMLLMLSIAGRLVHPEC